ncbi:MAG TPA: hypothetical protein VJX10_02010 [Pseudonocardiaceae bacterium]|nr:hypothetical protein [Pseudonocardiaceae bacterium]
MTEILANVFASLAVLVSVERLGKPLFEAVLGWLRRRRLHARISVQIDGERVELDHASDAEVGRLIDAFAQRHSERAQAERRLIEYSAHRSEAERWLAPYLPANPRRAKRLINHERLYTTIAEDRGVFGGDPELTHRHLAKWVLIVEHWPRLGAALVRGPGHIGALERAADVDELQAALTATVPGVYASTDLVQVLRDGIPLAPVLPRLVRFEPAEPEDLAAG